MTVYHKDHEILDKIDAIFNHLHNCERWFGMSTDQSGNNWAKETIINPFVITSSGIDTWSTGVYTKIIGSTDTPVMAGNTEFGPHRLLVSAVSSTASAVYKLRFTWTGSTGILNDGLGSSDYSEFMFKVDPLKNAQSIPGGPVKITTCIIDIGSRCWMQMKSTADGVTANLYVGIHEHGH